MDKIMRVRLSLTPEVANGRSLARATIVLIRNKQLGKYEEIMWVCW